MKTKEYHIHISPEFLFDEYEIFRYGYTPWVYLEIKLKYNFYLKNAPNKAFEVNAESLANTFATTKQTIYNSINELVETGFLIKQRRKYILVNEPACINKYKKVDADKCTSLSFIKMYKWLFSDVISDIKREILPMENYHRLIIKCLRLYYYLLVHDGHCVVFDDEPSVESTLTQTSLSKQLGSDHRVIKFLLNLLSTLGYIKIEDGIIYTLNKRTYDPAVFSYVKKESETVLVEKSEKSEKTVSDKPVDENKLVPERFIGYCKTWDGGYISMIYYTPNKKNICTTTWCKGDGVPPTQAESNIAENLKIHGRYSEYFNPESYWNHEREALNSAA